MDRVARECFDRVLDPINVRNFSVSGRLMSGLAALSLRTPPLLRFDRQVRECNPQGH